MVASLLPLVRSPVELAEAEVAVGDEGEHAARQVIALDEEISPIAARPIVKVVIAIWLSAERAPSA
jgi:hypothetical protein